MEIGALLDHQQLLLDPNDDGKADVEEPVKAVTVREFQAWIDKNVRFEKTPDPVLFPETVATIGTAAQKAEKIVPITYDHYIAPEARDGRTYGPRSWKRADGKHGSKTCDHSVVGVVVVGPERGEAFRVCIAKEKCTTHWGKEQKEKARRAKGGTGKEQERWKREEAKREAAREQAEVERKRWEKARPAILEAVSDAVAKAPVGPGSLTEKILVEGLMNRPDRVATGKLFPRGTTAEDLIRYLVFGLLYRDATFYGAYGAFPKTAKAFGIDTAKILDAVVPLGSPKPQATKTTGEKSKSVPKRRRSSTKT
jgi:hypothetical protein